MNTDEPTKPAAQPSTRWLSSIGMGVTYYYLTTLIVMLGVYFGLEYVHFCSEHPTAKQTDFISSFSAWDGYWYVGIVQNGYFYSPIRMSSVAFFPAYPLLAQSLVCLSGISAEVALFIVSQAALICSFVMAAGYVESRLADVPKWSREYVLLTMGLFPSTFYLRMAYTESLFLLLVIVTLYGVQKNWPIWIIAIVVGTATGTRSVGVALFAPLAVHIWATSSSWRNAIIRGCLVAPLATWGLLSFILYQQFQFNEPFAFVKTQAHWSTPGVGPSNIREKIVGLLTLLPIRSVYDESCRCYWARVPPRGDCIFNLHFLQPIAFMGTVAVILLGVLKKWLTRAEWVLGAGLMLVPYVMHADRTCMAGEMRYSSVVFPIYLVMGQFLARLPGPAAALISAFCGFFLAVFSAMFVSWYWYY